MARTYQHYEVVSVLGTHGLSIDEYSSMDFDETVNAINRIVTRAKELGYDNDEKWLIVLVSKDKEWDDDGMFLWEKGYRRTVAIYENGVVTRLGEA